MLRKTILITSLFFVTALTVLGWLIYRSTPGPTAQDIHGISIATPKHSAYHVLVSGRRLDCSSEATAPYSSTCEITIADKLLTIQAYRNEATRQLHFDGECVATYGSETLNCHLGSPVLGVEWFAYVDPLDLDDEQIDRLLRRYYFENLSEETYLNSLSIVPAIGTIAILAGVGAWLQPSRKEGWLAMMGLSVLASFILVAGFGLRAVVTSTLIGLLIIVGIVAIQRPIQLRSWLTPLALGLFSYVGTLFLALVLTSGFWD